MSLFFKNHDGQTPLDQSLVKELKLDHIQDMSELYEQERENIALAIVWLDSANEDIYDYLFWLKVHKKMFCDVWKFAGMVRKTELNNEDYSTSFNIRQEILELSRNLKIWHERKTYPLKEMVAVFHEKLLTIHPFRDGNARWARVLTEYVCLKLKITIPTWGIKIVDDEERRKKYIESVKSARHQGHYGDLIAIMFN